MGGPLGGGGSEEQDVSWAPAEDEPTLPSRTSPQLLVVVVTTGSHHGRRPLLPPLERGPDHVGGVVLHPGLVLCCVFVSSRSLPLVPTRAGWNGERGIEGEGAKGKG